MNSTLWAVRACFVAYGLTFATWASRIPDIQHSLGLTDGDLGKILFGMPVGQLLSLQLSGKVAQRFGSHRVTPVALSAYALVLVLLGQATASWQLALALLFFGFCGNMASTSLQTQGVITEKQAGRPLMPAYAGVWSLAGFSAGLLGTMMISLHVSPSHHFQMVAVLLILCLPLSRGHLLPGQRAQTQAKQARRFDPALIGLGVIGFCSMATEGCMFDWSGIYFRDVVKAPAALIVVGYTTFMISTAIFRFLGGQVVTRFGRLRVLQMGGFLMSSGLALSVAFPYLVPATLAFVIVGIGASNVMPNVYSLAGRPRPHDLGNALASVGQISFLGFLLGPPLIGQVASHLGLRVSFAVIACFGLGIPLMASRVLSMSPATEEVSPLSVDLRRLDAHA